MAALLGALRVELVLTAHPTEAKRRTVLSKLQRIGEMLRRLHDPDLLPRERDEPIAGLRGGDHRALAHRALPHYAPRRDRRGAHRALLRRGGLLGRAAADRRGARRGAAEHYPGLAPRHPVAHAGLVDRRRPRRQSVGGDAGDRRDAAPAPRPRRRAASPGAPRPRPATQHERRRCPPPPALTAWLDGATSLARARRLSRAALRRASPIAWPSRCSRPISRRRRRRT